MAHVAIGAPALPHNDRIQFGEMADALLEHYKVTGSRQLKDVHEKFKPVKAFFGHYRIMAIDHAAITGKTLRLAMDRGQLMRVPRIHRLQETS